MDSYGPVANTNSICQYVDSVLLRGGSTLTPCSVVESIRVSFTEICHCTHERSVHVHTELIDQRVIKEGDVETTIHGIADEQ